MSEFNNEIEENNGNAKIWETILRDFLPYWPVIFAAAIIGFISSKVYLRYQRPVHQAEAGILLKDESQSTDNLLRQTLGGQTQTPVEDELEIIKGTNVMQRAAKLTNTFYFLEWAGQFNNYTDHKKSQPFDIEFLNPDSINPFSAKLNVDKQNTGLLVEGVLYPFNQIVDLKGNRVFIHKKENPFNLKGYQESKKITLSVFDLHTAAKKNSFRVFCF